MSDDGNGDILLKTIKVGKNLFSLTERLPKPKYNRQHQNFSTLTDQNINNKGQILTTDEQFQKLNARNNSVVIYNTPQRINGSESKSLLRVQPQKHQRNRSTVD